MGAAGFGGSFAPLCGVSQEKQQSILECSAAFVLILSARQIEICAYRVNSANCNLAGHIRSISFDQPINIDAEGNIDFPVGKISIYQNDICFAIDMCMALDMRCGARKFCPAKLQFAALTR